MWKQKVRQFVRKSGFDVVRYNPRRLGNEPLEDMRRFLHNDRPLVLDVGANVGQSILGFRSKFPKCTIHSFEPSLTTFEKLSQQAAGLKDVHLWNCALGAVPGQLTFLENSKSDMSSFLPLGELGWGKIMKESLVEVKTVDQFCRDESIERIDILKSDTQGYDLEVFKGAEQSMAENRIGLIYFEIIFSEMYRGLPPFVQTYDFLTSRGFRLVSFYQFHHQRNLASWTDALFVHESYYLPEA